MERPPTAGTSKMLSAEEQQVVARARAGGRRARADGALAAPPEPAPVSYPTGISAKTLGLLGKVDALMKAEPQPPNWALLRVLSLLEESSAKGSS